MARTLHGTRWSKPLVVEPTYQENLRRRADARGLALAAQWLDRHGIPDAEGRLPDLPPRLLRGVRGLTSDGEPAWLRSLRAALARAW